MQYLYLKMNENVIHELCRITVAKSEGSQNYLSSFVSFPSVK